MSEKEYSVGDYILGGVFLIWFFGSIVMLFLTAKTAPALTLAVFGQIFLVIGIIALVSGLKQGDFLPIMLLFVFVGLFMIIWGYIMQSGDDGLQERFMTVFPYFALSAFLLTGILSLANSFIRNRRDQKCTQLIRATCVEIKRRKSNVETIDHTGSHMRHLYCPVFTYFYDGQVYEGCHNTYTRGCNAVVGNTYDIYINPDKPKYFKEEGETVRIKGMELGVGIVFTFISILGYIVLICLG